MIKRFMGSNLTQRFIKDSRRKLGWTQSKMAEKIGVSVDTVRSWEQGKRRVSLPAVKLINIFLQEAENEK